MNERKLDELNERMRRDLSSISMKRMDKVRKVAAFRRNYEKSMAKKCGKLREQCLKMLRDVLNGYDASDVNALLSKGNAAIIAFFLWRRDEIALMDYLSNGKYDSNAVRQAYLGLGAKEWDIDEALGGGRKNEKLIIIKLPRRKRVDAERKKDDLPQLTTIDDLPDDLFK